MNTIKTEVYKLDFLAAETVWQKEARKMFSQVETTNWETHIYNNTIAKVFIFFASSALPIEIIHQVGSVMNSVILDEDNLKKHLDRFVKCKFLRTRTTALPRKQTMYEVNFKTDTFTNEIGG